MRLTSALLLLAPMAGVGGHGCGAELPGPPVCASQSDCKVASACVLGRCRKSNRPPVSIDAKRLIVTPEDWVQISATGAAAAPTDAEVIRFGDAQRDDAVLLLRFGVELPAKARLQRALLVLDPMPRCQRTPGRLRLKLSHILEPWRSKSLSWSRQPQLGLPMHAAVHPTMPPQSLRLDVTDLVRAWEEHRGRYHGLALRAAGGDEGSACFTTGLTLGTGPRLELYLAPPKKKKRKKRNRSADAGADGAADGATDGGDGG